MSPGALWTFAVAVYGAPGVSQGLLRLQDEAGQNVPLLLWALWADPDPDRLREAAVLARAWDEAAIAPLRRLRRGLKAPPAALSTPAVQALRGEVQALELWAEQHLLEALETLTRSPAPPARPDDAARRLTRAAQAWGAPAGPDLSALIADLASVLPQDPPIPQGPDPITEFHLSERALRPPLPRPDK
ncbi:MAG TPA: TIGR02444 family protein [Phenylobacterium sp.]|nr:TIGR02444 family protein [Phenylobacterium sp.]